MSREYHFEGERALTTWEWPAPSFKTIQMDEAANFLAVRRFERGERRLIPGIISKLLPPLPNVDIGRDERVFNEDGKVVEGLYINVGEGLRVSMLKDPYIAEYHSVSRGLISASFLTIDNKPLGNVNYTDISGKARLLSMQMGPRVSPYRSDVPNEESNFAFYFSGDDRAVASNWRAFSDTRFASWFVDEENCDIVVARNGNIEYFAKWSVENDGLEGRFIFEQTDVSNMLTKRVEAPLEFSSNDFWAAVNAEPPYEGSDVSLAVPWRKIPQIVGASLGFVQVTGKEGEEAEKEIEAAREEILNQIHSKWRNVVEVSTSRTSGNYMIRLPGAADTLKGMPGYD